jgi:hypothetical protein
LRRYAPATKKELFPLKNLDREQIHHGKEVANAAPQYK